jgi:predicted permease
VHRDIRLALRLLWKEPAYAATAILTLAICLGANTALFTIVNSILLKPLPVPRSDRILLMSNRYPYAGGPGPARSTNSGVPDYYDRLRTLTVYDEQAMFNVANLAFDINSAPELVRGMAATPSLFRLLRVSPARGAIFDDRDGEIGNEQKIILSHGLWTQLFGSNAAVIGQTIRAAGRPFLVVGVMPRDFTFVDAEARFWIPLAFTAQQKSDEARHNNSWWNVGRLKDGATIEQAQAQLNALNAANLDRFPQFRELLINAGFQTAVERLQDVLVRDVRPTLYLLWGGAIVVLLIGGVNIANLALARSNLRSKEVATRLALGARRARVAQQLVVEGLLLSMTAGIAGIAIGWGILQTLTAIGLERLPRASEVHLDLTAIAAAFVLAIVVGIGIGLVPAAGLFNLDLRAALNAESRSGTGGRSTRAVRRALVVAQVAFAFVLLISSGLLLASFRNLLAVDPGFNGDHVITAGVGMPRVRYATDNDVRAFTARVMQTVRSVPGVIAAGGTTSIPFGGNHSDSVVLAEGYQMKPGESLISPMQVMVTPGYFEAIGTPLLRGRFFNDGDTDTAPGAIIVDERLARRFWGSADPIGKRMYKPANAQEVLKVDAHTRWLTVVGVVREVRMEDLAGEPNSVGAYYMPAAQVVPRGLALAIKTAADPAAVLKTVRTELNRIDPAMPLADIRTMDERAARSLMPRRTALLIALSFAIVALFLSTIGLYGVLAYVVSQRTREIGIRMALGSTVRGIFTLVLREGLVLIGSGLALGLAGAVALRRVMESQVYGVGTLDPIVIGLVIITLGSIAAAACSLPARRATRVDPVMILTP